LDVTSQCLQTVGGRAARKEMPLERIYRDVRTATLMPPNMDVSVELVGRAELDVH
jgi:alkylation response protein AidB-like acyl-CoA dehydrogenase